MDIDRVKLNPLGKTYYFNVNEYCCNKCKTGICRQINCLRQKNLKKDSILEVGYMIFDKLRTKK